MIASGKPSANGFVVVRLPPWHRGPYASPRCIGDFCYWGIDRLSWEDLDAAFYAQALPAEIERLYLQLQQQNADFTGLDLCFSLDDAKTLLAFSNRAGIKNDLLALQSPALTPLKGEIEIDRLDINWLGYDVKALGHWSLIADGCFLIPDYFREWVAQLNEYGLFPDTHHVARYIEFYDQAAEAEAAEPLPPPVYGTHAIRVGRLTAARVPGGPGQAS